MLRGLIAALALVGFAGCFSPDFRSGQVLCSPKGECPTGFQCAGDGKCYKPGDLPGADLAVVDFAAADLASLPDLTPPPDLGPVVFPPAAVWVSSGGGSSTAVSNVQLNFSIGGTSFVGTSTAPSGATCTFGYLSDDTF